MKKGMTKSLYIKPNTVKHCNELSRLAEENDTSFSDVMNDAVRQAYFQKRTGVWISPGAYLAIANKQLELLTCVLSKDGETALVINPDAILSTPEEPDATYPGMLKSTAYSIGDGLLFRAEEPNLECERLNVTTEEMSSVDKHLPKYYKGYNMDELITKMENQESLTEEEWSIIGEAQDIYYKKYMEENRMKAEEWRKNEPNIRRHIHRNRVIYPDNE